jgi:hypothetical protein
MKCQTCGFHCGFHWQTCRANDFSYFFDTFYGNCFTFNSGMKSNGPTAKYIKSKIPGPIYGLSLTLFLGDSYISIFVSTAWQWNSNSYS